MLKRLRMECSFWSIAPTLIFANDPASSIDKFDVIEPAAARVNGAGRRNRDNAA